MIVTGNKFQNNNFGHRSKSIIQKAPKTTAIATALALMSSLSGSAKKMDIIPPHLHEDIAIATKADSSNIFYKASLIRGQQNQVNFFNQVIDSVYGGKSKPNQYFKTDSLVQREAKIVLEKSDSIAKEGINQLRHADQLRGLAADILATK